jgi:hypothetical protein
MSFYCFNNKFISLNSKFFIVFVRYMYFVKTFCGDEAEMMLEEVLKNGYERASQIIVKTYQRLQQFPRIIPYNINLLYYK